MTPPHVIERRQEFARKLRQHVPVGTVRQTAKQIDPEHPERGRRNLNRWLQARVLPSLTSRIALAEALSLPSETFLDLDDEEEEQDLVAQLHEIARQHRQLGRTLTKALEAVTAGA